MGRKTIPPSQRNIPISISVKPKLADKIEQYAHDRRFSRSKFLTEAVHRYINFIEMGGLEGSENVGDMTLNRRFVIGLNALQEANREGETISAHLIDAMKDMLSIDEIPEIIETIPLSDEEALGDVAFVKTNRKSKGAFVYDVIQQDLNAEDGKRNMGYLIKRDIGSASGSNYWKYEMEEFDKSHPPMAKLAAIKSYVRNLLEVV